MPETSNNGPEVYPGYTCPDHPGPLDDARDHVCRLRPIVPDVPATVRTRVNMVRERRVIT